MVGVVGHLHGHPLLGCRRLSGTEGGPGIRSRHPHRHHRRRRVECRQAQAGPGRERHHPVHRRQFGRHRGRRHLHPARPLHPAGKLSRGSDRHLRAGIHQLPAGWCAGHPVPHSLPQILRQRHARQVPLPRSDGHHTGARVGREGRQPGQAAAGSRPDRRSVRLHRGHLRLVERELHHPLLLVGRDAGRKDQAGVQGERRCGRAGLGLHCRPKVRRHHLLRLAGRVVDHHPRHVHLLGRRRAEPVES